ncbi:hypothetical protein [Methylomonas rivi]|uniref:Uncharacterized protein n=1 Tax=Methylomonas rivi TaxID=2952226 RepID=A0ABT1U4H8_9GAMM|nr:hypothetical protein [Methylomonas sp. WSC-6]MCQ8128315.1 hypothetical protein [Methylomonas sp. WSC-6]
MSQITAGKGNGIRDNLAKSNLCLVGIAVEKSSGSDHCFSARRNFLGFFAAFCVFAGIPKESGLFIARAFGTTLGVLASVYAIKLLLGKEIGDFRIMLIKK